jgi:hypothetical protein
VAVCPNDRCSLWGRAGLPRTVRSFAEWCPRVGLPRKLTALQLFGRTLRQVQGVGPERAEAIVARFPTPAHLFDAYAALPFPARDGPLMLATMTVPGQLRAIGPALSRALFNAFFCRIRKEAPPPERWPGEDEDEDEDEDGGGGGDGGGTEHDDDDDGGEGGRGRARRDVDVDEE